MFGVQRELGWEEKPVGAPGPSSGSSIARSPVRFRTSAKLSFASVCGTRGRSRCRAAGRSGGLPKEIQRGNSDRWSSSGSRFL